jgi:pimeloyl-ACP methyl ester carboxylesterase
VPTLIIHGDDDQIVPINDDLLAFIQEQKGFIPTPGKTKYNEEENDK